MRGAGDPLTIGERVAFYRRRRGLAQATLAGLVGRSEDRLSKIAREVVRTLYRRAPVTAGKKSSLLLALAERCRAVSES